MPTIAGGWWTTKKRGRDDAIIERDRNEAIARRKELRRKKSSNSQSSMQLIHTKRGEPVEHDSSSWVKPPCKNPRRRKHRLREPISPQRVLFPKKSRLCENEIPVARKKKDRVHRLLCERCGDKIITESRDKHHERSPDPLPYTVQNFIGRYARKHKRSRTVVTPEHENAHENEQSYSCSKYQSEKSHKITSLSKRRLLVAKVLSFGDGEEFTNSATSRSLASNLPKHCCYSSTPGFNLSSKSKRERIRKSFAVTQLGPEPDFARSAKILHETARRRKRLVEENTNEYMDCFRSKGNSVAKALLPTPVESRHSCDRSTQKRSSRHGADVLTRTTKPPSEMQFKEKKMMIRYEAERGGDVPTKNEANEFGKRLHSNLLKPLSTQQEELNPKFRCSPTESSTHCPQGIKIRKSKPMNEQQSSPIHSTLLVKSANNSIPSSLIKNVANQPNTQRENASPSQTPSTASSALLSLPMNYHLFGSQQTLGESRGNRIRSQKEQNYALVKTDTIDKPVGSAENTKRGNGDPMRDIRFWQRIADQEERKNRNSNTAHSFKHTVASLVLAKNCKDCSNINDVHDGFLWLPSFLEGGLNNIGLLEE